MKNNFNAYIFEIFDIVKKYSNDCNIISSTGDGLTIESLPLFIGERVVLNGFDLESKFNLHRSPLKDAIVDIHKVEELFSSISKYDRMNLNHIGFCYLAMNLELEKIQIYDFCKKSKLKMYHETMQGFDPWYFVGNVENISGPMIEFLPTTIIPPDWRDSKDMWLPQIQIDVDTTTTPETMRKLLDECFQKDTTIFNLFEHKGKPVVTRVRLGILDGVNINLDIGTNLRDTKYYRYTILQLIP